jgi:hypothetical protein
MLLDSQCLNTKHYTLAYMKHRNIFSYISLVHRVWTQICVLQMLQLEATIHDTFSWQHCICVTVLCFLDLWVQISLSYYACVDTKVSRIPHLNILWTQFTLQTDGHTAMLIWKNVVHWWKKTFGSNLRVTAASTALEKVWDTHILMQLPPTHKNSNIHYHVHKSHTILEVIVKLLKCHIWLKKMVI